MPIDAGLTVALHGGVRHWGFRYDEPTRFLSNIRDDVTQTVAASPEHAAYVARYCGAVGEKAA